MLTITELETNPDPGRTIEGLRDTGYNFETAVADVVDNSIAANATKIDIRVELDFRNEVVLTIADNGCGMNKNELTQAMMYGSPAKADPASLGKFGLGLKTASTAFCRRLSVISRSSGNENSLMATWDLDHVISKNKWLLQLSEEPGQEALDYLDAIADQGPGTVVLWEKVDRLLREYKTPGGVAARNALKKRCQNLKEHLAMTYQRFIDSQDERAQDVRITLNGEVVEPWDPFQKEFSELVAKDTVEVEIDNSETLAEFSVQALILPRREEFPEDGMAKAAKLSSDKQGLYIYREQRLIHAAGWLGMFQNEPHGTLLRVEFSFDHRLDSAFHLDVKKSQIILNDDLWIWLKDQFLTAPRREADRRYRQGRKKAIGSKNQGAHDASNQSIGIKELEVGGPEVSIRNRQTGEVEVSNSQGIHVLRLKLASASKPGEVYVQPTDDVADGLLFEPALIEIHKAVRINTQHPYYHKVYVPNLNQSVTVQGMDSLFWALCVAELSTTSGTTNQAFKDLRFEVSRILRTLVENLPEPDLDD